MIQLERKDHIAQLTLDRPDRLNAVSLDGWRELQRVTEELHADDDVRAVVVCGAGRCFCAGADIGDLEQVDDRASYTACAMGALELFEALPKPTIAAVHGEAFGAGLELSLMCDIVVADATARFAAPEAKVGLIPATALSHGDAHMPLHWLKYLAFTGNAIDGDAANRAGLVTILTPAGEHIEAAREIASTISRRAPLALAECKRLLNQPGGVPYSAALEANARLQETADAAEGMAAFRAKRAPRFTGR